MKRLAMLIFVTVLSNSAAWAGGATTGGGGAYVCNEHGRERVYLVDLWEGSENENLWNDRLEPYKLNISTSNKPVKDQIERALKKLDFVDPGFAIKVRQDLDYVMTHHENVPAGKDIETPHDVLDKYSKEHCELKGMMLYDGIPQKLEIKRERFKNLVNNTNIAASWTHEAIYKTMRDIRDPMGAPLNDSTEARKLNACLYSTDDCLGIRVATTYNFPRGYTYRCQSKSYDVIAYAIDQFQGASSFVDQVQPATRWTFKFFKIGSLTYPVPITVTRALLNPDDKTDNYHDAIYKIGKGVALFGPTLSSPLMRIEPDYSSQFSRGYFDATTTHGLLVNPLVNSQRGLDGIRVEPTTISTTQEEIGDETLTCAPYVSGR